MGYARILAWDLILFHLYSMYVVGVREVHSNLDCVLTDGEGGDVLGLCISTLWSFISNCGGRSGVRRVGDGGSLRHFVFWWCDEAGIFLRGGRTNMLLFFLRLMGSRIDWWEKWWWQAVWVDEDLLRWSSVLLLKKSSHNDWGGCIVSTKLFITSFLSYFNFIEPGTNEGIW